MDFGVFGQWWMYNPGAWWDNTDWGTVPAWVSGILTSVSVFLAIWILRSNQKQERALKARALVVWVTKAKTGNVNQPHHMTIHVYNSSEEPIPAAWLRIQHRGSSSSWSLREPGSKLQLIKGKADFTMPLDSTQEIAFEGSLLEVHLIDATNQFWKRDLRTNKTTKLKYWNMPGGIL